MPEPYCELSACWYAPLTVSETLEHEVNGLASQSFIRMRKILNRDRYASQRSWKSSFTPNQS